MKLPSLTQLAADAETTLKKFPLSIVSGIIIAITGITLTEKSGLTRMQQDIMMQLILTLIFAIPLFASIQLAAAKNNLDPNKRVILKIGAVLLAIAYYIFVLPPPEVDWLSYQIVTTCMTIGSSFLLLTFAPFIKIDNDMSFWHYAKDLRNHFSLTVFFAVVLWGGISLILFSIDELLFSIHDELYLDSWIVIAAVFSPWVFLTNLSKDLEEPVKNEKMMKFTKGFGQFIMTPLLAAYTVVLYAYTAKVIFTQEWPEGIISSLIIGFAVAGMLTHIVLYAFQEKNEWIKTAQKVFYIALMPLTLVLFWAISIRIGDYGITESRYYVVMLGVWLIGMALYFTFSREKKIKHIPASVFILLLLSLFGPWSAFSVSESSQLNRLETLLNGEYESNIENDELDRNGDIRSIVRYITRTHGVDGFSEEIKAEFSEGFNELRSYQQSNLILENLGIKEGRSTYSQYEYYSTNQDHIVISVGGYDYLTGINFTTRSRADIKIPTPDGWVKVQFHEKGIRIVDKDKNEMIFDAVALAEELKKKSRRGPYTQEQMMITKENDHFDVRLQLERINLRIYEGTKSLDDLSGDILIKVK